MTFVEFLVLTLAVFRLARLVIEDTITEPLRTLILSHWPGQNVEYERGDKVRGGVFQLEGKLYAQEPTWLGDRIAKLISCYHCAGAWIGFAVGIAFLVGPVVTFRVALPWALAGAVSIIGPLMHEAVE